MQYIQGTNRHQTCFTTPDEQVSADNAVRLMDAFIDKLDLQKLGFTGTVHKSEGRPPYAPGVLLKLYLYCTVILIKSAAAASWKKKAAVTSNCNGCCRVCNQTIIPLPASAKHMQCLYNRCLSYTFSFSVMLIC
jgi:hypothetical protein